MHAMMQCKAKSENLAHILGYQIWAVTMPGLVIIQGYSAAGVGGSGHMKSQVSTWNVLARHQSTINRNQRSYMAWHECSREACESKLNGWT